MVLLTRLLQGESLDEPESQTVLPMRQLSLRIVRHPIHDSGQLTRCPGIFDAS